MHESTFLFLKLLQFLHFSFIADYIIMAIIEIESFEFADIFIGTEWLDGDVILSISLLKVVDLFLEIFYFDEEVRLATRALFQFAHL